MAKPKTATAHVDTETVLQIEPLKRKAVTLRIIGDRPLYFHSMSLKVQATLLLGGGKKSAAEKKELKHNPEQEFRDSVTAMEHGPTLLGFPASGIKGSMATAALRTEGVTKTSIQQLVWLPQDNIPIWGTPLLKMDVVRSADMNKTPDVRTRAYLPRWCSSVDITFLTPALNTATIVTLLANAGVVCGIGDFRQEKGRGSYGTFSVYGEDMDEDAQKAWDEITQQGRQVQQDAMDHPTFADRNTADLMAMLQGERRKRA